MSDRILVSGEPVPTDGSHTELKQNGQQRDYVVLTPEERAKGFVKPVRRTYVHRCGAATTMGLAIAETYARNPRFYSSRLAQQGDSMTEQVPSDANLWPSPPLLEIRTEYCPECSQECGWCSANRLMCRLVGCATIYPKQGKCAKGEQEKGRKCSTCDGSGKVKVKREIIK